MRLMLALAITLVAAPLASEEGVAEPGPLAAPTSCTATGARVTSGGRTTSTYSIDLSAGVTCAFAKPWVARLSPEPVNPTSGEISAGPAGWYCQRGGRPEKRAEVGSCSHNTATKSFFFSWQPLFSLTPEGCYANGARVKLSGHPPSTTYAIYELHGVTCAFAKPWVARLSHMRVDPTTRKISGGPLGWTCYGGGKEKRATLGSCANHTGAKRFYWDVAFGVK